jgi:hypothetical protein
VLVPGWTAPGVVFGRQLEHFSKSYRVITSDPHSQGLSPERSTTTTMCAFRFIVNIGSGDHERHRGEMSGRSH